jgi:pimeloyl-ACP methyl ester carboxylesterase
MSGGTAMIYAASYPVRGAIIVDSPVDLRPFAHTVKQLAPALRGPGFADAFGVFDRTMGIDLVPEPLQTVARDAHEVRQDVVLGYWDQLLRSNPEELQASVEEVAARIDVPCLAVYGRPLSSDDRDYLLRLVPSVQLEEWPGLGHCVHLADADRFAARLRAFADFCERGSS